MPHPQFLILLIGAELAHHPVLHAFISQTSGSCKYVSLSEDEELDKDVILECNGMLSFLPKEAKEDFSQLEFFAPYCIDVPLIVLAEERHRSVQKQMLELGAWDVLCCTSLKSAVNRFFFHLEEAREFTKRLADGKKKRQLVSRLDLALEFAGFGTWEWNIQTGKITFSNQLLQLLSYQDHSFENEFKGAQQGITHWDQFMHPNDVDSWKISLDMHLQGRRVEYFSQHRMMTGDGHWIWVNDRGKVVEYTPEGEPLILVGITQNVHQQRQTEESLIETNRRITSLIGSLPGVVFRWEYAPERTVQYISDRCKDVFGVPSRDFYRHDAEGNIWQQILKPSERERVWKEVKFAIDQNKPYDVTYSIKVGDEERFILEQGAAICDENGFPNGLEGYAHDITLQKKAQEKIMSTMLETEDRERSRIAKEIHDSLGQNLTSAFLNLEGVKTVIDDFGPAFKERMEKGLEFLNQAIDESRSIAHNLMPKAIHDFGLVLTIQSMLNGLKYAQKGEFDFLHNLMERLPQQMELGLYRITQEAINNILKHADAKHVTLQLMKYDHEIIYTIEDDGKGFEKESLKHSFGIQSIRNRVMSLSGQVEFDSVKGKGTYITIHLPILTT